MEFMNPILTGFYPDPSICRVGTVCYMVNSTFEYLPGIPVWRSTDLVNWEKIGHCITRPSQMTFPGTKASKGLFAPSIRYADGIFYVVCTNTSREGPGNFLVTSSDPAGPWSDPVWLDQTGIDPSLFFDEDGSVYLTSNGVGPIPGQSREGGYIQQSRIDRVTGACLEGPRLISTGTGGRCVEGPHLYRINSWYYLLLAEGGTESGHMITVFRSLSPWGPFESCPHNPVLTARDEAYPELTGTGHGDLIEDGEGNWWMVFLCYRIAAVKYHHLGRETALVPITWKDGWPVPADGRVPGILVRTEGHGEVYQKSRDGEDFTDTFEADTLHPEWNVLREFFQDYHLAEGGLVMTGRAETLSEEACPAFIGRRQCHMDMVCQISLSFHPRQEAEEAGLTVLCSNRAHYDLGIRKRKEGRFAVLHKVVEDMETWQEIRLQGEGPVMIRVKADRNRYEFSVVENGKEHQVGTGMTKLLSTEVNWGFTGVYLGMYATGNGSSCSTPAIFHKFTYKGR